MARARMTALFRSEDGKPNLVSIDVPPTESIADVVDRIKAMGFTVAPEPESFVLFKDHSNARAVCDKWLTDFRQETR